MRLEILLTAVFFFGGAGLSGYALRRILKLKKESVLFSVVTGVMLWWALMELILVPLTMQLASFQSFVLIYTAVVVVLMLVGILSWREILEDGKAALMNLRLP